MRNLSLARVAKIKIQNQQDMQGNIMGSATQLLDAYLTEMHRSFSDVQVDCSTNTSSLPLVLFSRMMCGGDTSLVLLKTSVVTFIPVILRTVMEAYADMLNLMNDKWHIKVMLRCMASQEMKLLYPFSKSVEYKDMFSETSIPKLRLNKACSLLYETQSLENDTKIIERFKNAPVPKEYFAIYNDMCRDTHNNLDKIIEKHAPCDFEEALVHKRPQIADVKNYVGFIIDILQDSAECIIVHYELRDVDISASKEIARIFKNDVSLTI